jgi:mono/diheme cytochrome c family protein
MGLRAAALLLIAGFGFSLAPLEGAATVKNSEEFFEARIRPLLAKNCFACHTAARMGGLELDSREHVLKGGKDGPVVVPGKPEESILIQAVRRTHPRFKMPPQGKLSDE